MLVAFGNFQILRRRNSKTAVKIYPGVSQQNAMLAKWNGNKKPGRKQAATKYSQLVILNGMLAFHIYKVNTNIPNIRFNDVFAV